MESNVLAPAIRRIVNLGDSVPWGQGLAEADKYDALVQKALGPAVTLQRLAHSGAIIGLTPVNGPARDGEVPVPQPTILQQCAAFNDSPANVDLVLVDGGINDVDVRTILNPLVPAGVLSAKTQAACHDAMLVLLRNVAAKFTAPQCRIIVTGYYPIISGQSDVLSIPAFLGLHGIALPAFLEDDVAIGGVISHCQQFFIESTAFLRQAVTAAADARIVYVDSGFTDANSVFAPEALLWGLQSDVDLSPVDEVAPQRHAACDVAFDLLQTLEREQCYRASAGHPNPAGARQFAKQILAAIGAA